MALAIKKYGRDIFRKEIIEECGASNINEREKFWINFYKSRDRGVGYNIAEGGSGGDTMSKHPNKAETKQKISKANIGKIMTQEAKQKISEANSGERNGFYGKKHTIENIEI